MEQIIGIQSDVIKHSSPRLPHPLLSKPNNQPLREEGGVQGRRRKKAPWLLGGLISGSRYSSVHRVIEGGAQDDSARLPCWLRVKVKHYGSNWDLAREAGVKTFRFSVFILESKDFVSRVKSEGIQRDFCFLFEEVHTYSHWCNAVNACTYLQVPI